MNNRNPYKYLAHVLHVLANQKTGELALDKLMPYSENMKNEFNMKKEQ